ncbi:lysine transporter LysE [Flavobacterium akiainvivens]|uniref:Lysine transporter LysE n=1 Tax=Flavobacterium akiainvivens TaxID=1202724 RepID=A0A0M9VIP6_9FLAO|nr:LysE family transporter [Flavobacterium akiainvivens]KOS06609.1 lysine transporter LysE [Flavobacterium akiainvivens]SFQ09198.1 Threonine/homoserine/homoserine lactone efflux protein [Flavobacterium akiainvivens]
MDFILPVIVGFAISFVATLLPGLLNMTAAKVSLKEGRKNAMFFAVGAAVVVFFQAYIAVSFAKFINSRPDVIEMLEEVGICIFALLTVYFLLVAKKKKKKKKKDKDMVKMRSNTGNFFMGVLLSGLNFFPIPYYVFISISFTAYGFFKFTNPFVPLFVMGVVAGAFTVFYLYIVFFKKFEHKTDFFMRNVNYFIGSITGLIALVTLLRILQNR